MAIGSSSRSGPREGKKTLTPVAAHVFDYGVWWHRANTLDDHSGPKQDTNDGPYYGTNDDPYRGINDDPHHGTNDGAHLAHLDRRRSRDDGPSRRGPAHRKSGGASLEHYG